MCSSSDESKRNTFGNHASRALGPALSLLPASSLRPALLPLSSPSPYLFGILQTQVMSDNVCAPVIPGRHQGRVPDEVRGERLRVTQVNAAPGHAEHQAATGAPSQQQVLGRGGWVGVGV